MEEYNKRYLEGFKKAKRHRLFPIPYPDIVCDEVNVKNIDMVSSDGYIVQRYNALTDGYYNPVGKMKDGKHKSNT